jgi:hypothetical protein
MGPGIIAQAKELGLELPPEVDKPDAEITPAVLLEVTRRIAWHFFPLLAPDSAATPP